MAQGMFRSGGESYRDGAITGVPVLGGELPSTSSLAELSDVPAPSDVPVAIGEVAVAIGEPDTLVANRPVFKRSKKGGLSDDDEVWLRVQMLAGETAARRLEEWGHHVDGGSELDVLLEDITYGRAARDRLVDANIGLVANVYDRRFWNRPPTHMQRDDCIQEGVMGGLMPAIEIFDPTRGLRLSTVAIPRIYTAIKRALENYDRAVRLPVHVTTDRNKYETRRRDLLHELGRDPTNDEVAASLGITVEELQKVYVHDASLLLDQESPLDGSPFVVTLPDPARLGHGPRAAEKWEFYRQAGIALRAAGLNTNEIMVLALTLGLADGHSWAQFEIKGYLGRNATWVSSNLARARKKLGASAEAKEVMSEWENEADFAWAS